MSKTPKRSCAWQAGNQEKNLRHQPPGGPSVPTPPLVRCFQKLTHSQGVRGAGSTGFPAGPPGGPAPVTPPSRPARQARERAPQRRPPMAPAAFSLTTAHCPAGEWTQGHRHRHTPHRTQGREAEAPTPRPAFIESPRGQLCKFPLDLSFSKGHSRLGTESLLSKGPASPPLRLLYRKPHPDLASPATQD